MSSAEVNQEAVALDCALADLLDLGLLAKQAHWNLVGPRLGGTMHQLLDDLTRTAHESADLVGERSLALGRTTDVSAARIASLSPLPPLSPGALRQADTIRLFANILDVTMARILAALEAFDKDPVTSALFTGILASIERYAWMLRTQDVS